jgi:hypothetical protein
LVKEEAQSDEDREVVNKKREMKQNKIKHVEVLEERVLKLEKQIKLRFNN